MRPVVYEPKITDDFSTNGYGALCDCISCIVTQETSTADGLGANVLELEYPLDGTNAGCLKPYTVILAKANDNQQAQPFDIYSVEHTDSVIKVQARHVLHRLAGFPITHFPTQTTQCTTLAQFVSGLGGKNFYGKSSGFTFISSGSVSGSAYHKHYQIAQMLDIITDGLANFGCEMSVDRFAVKFAKQLGSNTGVTIRYGKNITSIERSNECADTYNSVCTYYSDPDGSQLATSGSWINSGRRPYVYCDLVDKTRDITSYTSYSNLQSQLNTLREPLKAYVSDTGAISITVDIIALWQSDEYAHYRDLEKISLYDTVRLIHEPLGINEDIRVVKTVYDTLAERYTEIELGAKRENLADQIAKR